jgi:hypothetical protein
LYEGECITVAESSRPANCFAIETNGACGFCQKGYNLITLSGVKKCVQITVANCESFHQIASMSVAVHSFVNMYIDSPQNTCSKCVSGFNNLKNYNDLMDYLVQNDMAPSFVKH